MQTIYVVRGLKRWFEDCTIWQVAAYVNEDLAKDHVAALRAGNACDPLESQSLGKPRYAVEPVKLYASLDDATAHANWLVKQRGSEADNA